MGQLHTSGLNWYAGTSWTFSGNVVSQVNQEFWSLNPAGNSYVTAVSQLGLSPDYSLGLSSPYRGKASDGTDPGANVAEVLRRTAGVVVAP